MKNRRPDAAAAAALASWFGNAKRARAGNRPPVPSPVGSAAQAISKRRALSLTLECLARRPPLRPRQSPAHALFRCRGKFDNPYKHSVPMNRTGGASVPASHSDGQPWLARTLAPPGSWPVSRSERNKGLSMNLPLERRHPCRLNPAWPAATRTSPLRVSWPRGPVPTVSIS